MRDGRLYAVLFVLLVGQASGFGVAVARGGSGDATVSDGGTYYLGQTLSTDRYESTDSVDLERADGSFVTAVRVDGGTLTLDTGGLSAGAYELTSSTGPTVAFDLVRQTYAVEPGRDTVATADPTLDIAVRSNRADYTHAIRSPDLDASTLQTLFGGAGTVGPDGETLRLSGGARQSLSANFSSVSPGTYRLVFAVTDTAASERVEVSVDSRTERVTFATPAKVVDAEVGDVAAIPLRFERTDTARLTVGSAALNWKVALTVTDADGDGSATVRVDTANARQSGTVFTARGADTVSTVTVIRGSQFADADRRIAADAYPLSVETGDRETDVATLSLRSETGVDRLCNRNADSLVDAYNDNVDAVPGFLAGTVTDTTIHGIVTDAEARDYTITTGSDRRVAGFHTGSPDDAAVELETDCATVRTVADADNTTDAFGTAYADGEIQVRGVGPIDTVLVEVLELGVRIGDLFGLG